MFGKTRNPKSDIISQATERRTVFPRLALRQRSHDHPMVMFVTIACAAFIWTLLPGQGGAVHSSLAPASAIQDTKTTAKASRLPVSEVEHACQGQSWGGESADCLRMIARENGKADLRVRLIADAAPTDIETPNIF